MSRTSVDTSVELSAIKIPSVTAKSSVRRPSFNASIASAPEPQDDSSIHSLHPIATVTTAGRTAAIIASVTLITAISTLLNGLTTVALPTMAIELDIPTSLLLWPSSIQALTNGCTLLISGAIADALGSRFMYLTGCVLQAGCILGCGLSRSSTQLIVFRGLSGIALSFCLPPAVSIITHSFTGKRRDLAFASMGGGQPIGFSVGLALGGVLTDTIGWRYGFYISAILNVIVFAIALWGLPTSIDNPPDAEGPANYTWALKFNKLRNDIDWVGAMIASTSLAMLSYALAAISGSTTDIRKPSTITILVVALALIPVFILWVGRQERLGKPAIIPNSLWRNRIFTSICIAVFLTWGSFNALETILTFFFQKLQGLSAIQTSLRFLPAPVSGAVFNILTGLVVHRIAANYLVIGGCTLSVVAPLVMAFATKQTSFWAAGFLANIFNPTGADSLFTVSNLLITSVFPSKTQALAGGVFNTIAQIGKSVGLALVAVIAETVTARSDQDGKDDSGALLEGYHATFWFCFASVMITIALCCWGLRGIGRVGHKRD